MTQTTMNALLKSFVNKVHLHATASEVCEDAEEVVKYLLPVLSCSGEMEVKVRALYTLSRVHHRTESSLRHDPSGAVLDAVLDFVAGNRPSGVPSPCIRDVCDLVLAAELAVVRDACSQRGEQIVSTLWTWFSSAPPDRFFPFVSLCTVAELDEGVHTIRNMDRYIRCWGSGISRSIEHTLLAIRVAVPLLGTEDAFEVWWRTSGHDLCETYSRFASVIDGTADTTATDVLLMVTEHVPFDTPIPLCVPSQIMDACCNDVLRKDDVEDGLVSSVEKVSRLLAQNRSLQAQFLAHEAFVVRYCHTVLERFQTLNPVARNTALDLLTAVATVGNILIQEDVIDALYRLDDHETAYRRSLLFAYGMPTSRVVGEFARLLSFCEQGSDENDTSLDCVLCNHFDTLVEQPRHVVGVDVDGNARHVLFHCISNLLGDVPLGTSYVSNMMRTFLEDGIASVWEQSRSRGTLLYIEHLRNTYDLTGGSESGGLPEEDRWRMITPKYCIPTCPITLEAMHCPVVASDGHTYELSAIAKVLRGTGKSPLTREELRPWVVFNRAMHSADEMLCSVVKTVATHVRRRERRERSL